MLNNAPEESKSRIEASKFQEKHLCLLPACVIAVRNSLVAVRRRGGSGDSGFVAVRRRDVAVRNGPEIAEF